MRLKTVQIEQMGPYHGESISFHTAGLQVLFGANEAGKSTLLAALRGALFGQPRLAEGLPQTRPGAAVTLTFLCADGTELRVERNLTRRHPPRLFFADGTQVTGQVELVRAVTELQQIEQVLFDTFFTMQLSDLTAFAEKPGALANQLFGVRAPLVNPYELEAQLERRQKDIYNPHKRATKPLLNAVAREQAELACALRNSHDAAAWYRQTLQTRQQLEQALAEQTRHLTGATRTQKFWQRCVSLYEDVRAFNELEAQLGALGSCPSGQLSTWANAAQWMRQREAAISALNETRVRLSELDGELQSSVSEGWRALHSSLTSWQRRLVSMAQQLLLWQEANRQQTAAEAGIAEARQLLPNDWTTDEITNASQFKRADGDLLTLAANWERRQRAVEEADDRFVLAKSRTASQRQMWQTANADRSLADIVDPDAAVIALAEQERNLRRQSDELRIDMQLLTDWQLRSQKPVAVREQHGRTQDRQGFGVAFAAAVFLLCGAGIEAFVRDWMLTGIFVIAALALGGWTLLSMRQPKRSARVHEDPPPHLHNVRQEQISLEQADKILDDLHDKHGYAEGQLRQLEQQAAALAKWQQAVLEQRAREVEQAAASEQRAAAVEAYRKALADWQMTDTLWSVNALHALCDAAVTWLRGREQAAATAERQATCTEQWQACLADFLQCFRGQTETAAASVLRDVERALVESFELSATQETIHRLQVAVDDWAARSEAAIEQEKLRAAAMEKQKYLRQEEQRQQKQAEDLAQKIQRVFDQLGVDDEQTYQLALEREQTRARLHQARERHLNQLIVACGGEREAAAVRSQVKGTSLRLLEAQQSMANTQAVQAETDLAACQEQLWQIKQSLTASQTDTEGVALRWHASQLDARAQSLRETYAALALARKLSQLARTKVEARQDAPVLRFAGNLLCEVTDGRYVSVRVPLGGEGMKQFYVMDADGQSWSLESLSRGTRELVYLVLRLAVIREYRERGVILPVILDDVLVNFDDARACRMMRLFAREAAAGQWIYFTCHSRLLSMLTDLPHVNMVRINQESGGLV